MKLPNASRATVPRAKMLEYLLSETHPLGRHKAVFFTGFGFTRRAWNELSTALVRHACEHEVSLVEDSPFGKRYDIDGIIATPSGRSPRIRSVWFIETASDTPRFVTAFPLREGKP
ncbi:MAG: DUF6883 domain-containing protein [Candidatus Binataceae bacterium]